MLTETFSPRPTMEAEPKQRLKLLETYRPTEQYESVAAIGVDRITELIDSGRTLFISDIDGTAAANGSFEVSPETHEIYKTISDHPDAKLVFWTNIAGKSEDEIIRMQWIAETQGAEFVTFRDAPDETKPSPAKIHAIIERINSKKDLNELPITTGNTVMIGDKLSADIRAGNFAKDENPMIDGVHTIWVDRLGAPLTDLKGDLFLRRPLEKMLWIMMGKKGAIELKKSRSDDAEDLTFNEQILPLLYEREKQPTRNASVHSEILNQHSLVANVGNGPELHISEEKFATLQPPRTEPLHLAMRGLMNSKVLERIEARAAEHGKDDANIITLARIAGIPVVIGALLLNKPKLARAAFVGLSITDVIDGYLAGIYKKHNPEQSSKVEEVATHPEQLADLNQNIHTDCQAKLSMPEQAKIKLLQTYNDNFIWDTSLAFTENIKQNYENIKQKVSAPGWGTKWDPKADKYLGNSAEAVLVLQDPLLVAPVAATFARDIYRERVQRPKYEGLGYVSQDLGATRSSKNSSALLNLAVVVAMSGVSRKTKFAFQAAAAAGKWFSLFGSVPIWKRRRAFREAANEKHELLKEMHVIPSGRTN